MELGKKEAGAARLGNKDQHRSPDFAEGRTSGIRQGLLVSLSDQCEVPAKKLSSK